MSFQVFDKAGRIVEEAGVSREELSRRLAIHAARDPAKAFRLVTQVRREEIEEALGRKIEVRVINDTFAGRARPHEGVVYAPDPALSPGTCMRTLHELEHLAARHSRSDSLIDEIEAGKVRCMRIAGSVCRTMSRRCMLPARISTRMHVTSMTRDRWAPALSVISSPRNCGQGSVHGLRTHSRLSANETVRTGRDAATAGPNRDIVPIRGD